MKKKEPQSFEVAGYSDVEFGITEAQRAIVQIFRDIGRDCPAHAVWGDVIGDQLKIHYMTYTMHLPRRIKEIEAETDEILKQTVIYLKKEFRERTGKALKLKEQKELGNHAIERVSLNERYIYRAWRFYEMSF